MLIGSYIIDFSPTDEQINEIESWLIDEDKKTKEGFYCNWNVIKTSYDKKQIATISHCNRVVGFVTYHLSTDYTLSIDIAEVEKSNRKKGIGKQLINELLKYFRNKGVVVAHLQCAPPASEPIWKKMKFSDFPDTYTSCDFYSPRNKHLFQILTDCLEPDNSRLSNEQIEVWSEEPSIVENLVPSYIWHIEYIPGTRTIIKPIIHPAHYDWRIRWTVDGRIISDGKIKRFGGGEIFYNAYIIIDKLPELHQRN